VQADSNFFKILLRHELNAAERYRRFVSLAMISCSQGMPYLRNILNTYARKSDAITSFNGSTVVLMDETNEQGALVAIKRYRNLLGRECGMRFSIVTYPHDETTADRMLEVAHARLDSADMDDAYWAEKVP
jgi:hypothetical protein